MPGLPQSRRVQRILFPDPDDTSARALYLRSASPDVRWERSSITVPPRGSVSLATYFGVFPAAYWAAHTRVRTITVAGRVEGAATVRLCAADTAVGRRVLSSAEIDGDFSWPVPTDSADWFWLELEGGDAGATLRDGAWFADSPTAPRATVCITTHNRGVDCLGVLRRLLSDPEALMHIPRIIVVDQGDQPLRHTAGYAGVAERLGSRLRLIEQPNLGGSGGFSRGMIESLNEEVESAMLLDDDVTLETESVTRMLAFAAHAKRPTIVGAQMLSQLDRTLLHSVGERIDRRSFWWTSVATDLAPVDLATTTIDRSPRLRERHEVDFNGWWMCLVPISVVRDIGAALPLFIKWDDAEYGLRAAGHGVPTVTLPGAALWHMPWTGKDDGLDWQAYFQLRNRLVAALLHATSRRGTGVLLSSFAQDVNHILCVQYGSGAARRVALRDVLEGPRHLPITLARRAGDTRTLMATAGQVVVPPDEVPTATGKSSASAPGGWVAAIARLGRVIVHQFRPPRTASVATVDVALTRAQGKWWALGLVDSAAVASATGTGSFVSRRDRRISAVLLRDAVRLRIRLWLRWPRLAAEYRTALPALTSPESWRDHFTLASAPDDVSA